ncbi:MULTISPECIES: sensor histidine kinase [Sphingobacterium]|uniref:histidine kinase n=3 Tax=Sphingobacterium multivorum TaxID=28454 RepID=A0A2X2IYR6_SPHMU|nr:MULTISPECIES: HAMP domain-containing sensor histidine kinase [Sphingobacterium]QRQ60649.1 HAMP domain-containing histidine kinase [Sphingobacterium multivorum]SPZ87307.1 Signal-transduction histidine kinase senX3 [Sphingobacterium multivorum]
MELKPKSYIVLFTLFFAVLIGIQGYQLYNTYQLKQRDIFATVKSKLGKLHDNDKLFDDDLMSKDIARDYYIKLVKNEITAEKLKGLYSANAHKTSQRLTQYVDSLFQPLGMDVILKKEILGIYFKSLEKQIAAGPITIYTTSGAFRQPVELSSSEWITEKTETQKIENSIQSKEVLYTFLVHRKTSFEVTNLNWILFKELTSLLLSTLFILVAFLWLFYRTIQNLRKQQKQISVLHDVVDNISHELKTPIATLKIAAKTLRKSTDDNIITVIERQANRLEQTLNPLSENLQTRDQHPITNRELHAIFEDFQLTNPAIAFQLSLLPDGKLCLSLNDATTLFQNLMNNAVKYGATWINISFEDQKGKLSIYIQDNGYGMAESELPYIFDKFYRIQKDNIHDSKGLGIGLFLVKTIVDRYHGQLTVTSKPDVGTTFKIQLPLVAIQSQTS